MTTQSLAYRVGSALGVIAGALLHARKPGVRWIKRALVVGLLLWVVVANFSWLVSSLLTLGCLALLLAASSRLGTSVISDIDLSITTNRDGYEHDGFYAKGVKLHD